MVVVYLFQLSKTREGLPTITTPTTLSDGTIVNCVLITRNGL